MQNPNDSSPAGHANLDSSDHNLSNELRQLAEEEVKSGVITDHPQRSFQNMSRIESNNNTVLAHSELIQLPLQQFLLQQQQGLRVSLPAQTGNMMNVYPQNGNQQNAYLRASLPAQANNPQRQGSQMGSAWIAQPATTQARVESGNRSFVFPNTNSNTGLPRPNNMMQQGQVIVQNRPSSSSPNRIVFNYQGNTSNVSPPPVQPIVRPQQPPQPQPQPLPQSQPKPQQQTQPIQQQQIQPQQIQQQQNQQIQPQAQPQSQNNNALFILPQPNSEVILWQQRYFMLLQKFHFYYSRLEIIHKKSIYLDQAILQTKRTQQLQLLRSESQDLLTVITTTEQELVETIQRNREILTVISNWRQKYEQLSRAYDTLKQAQTAANKDLLAKVEQQTKQIAELETNYNSIVKLNEEEANRNRKLQQQLAYLNEQLRSNLSNSNNHKEFQLQLSELSKIISDKNDVIVSLRKVLEAKTSTASNSEAEKQLLLLIEENNSSQILIGQLREENQNLSSTFKKTNIQNQAKISKYQELIYQYEATIQTKEAETKRLQSLLDSKTSEPSPNPSKPTPSPQGTPRTSELQIQNRRLKHELTLYEQSHSSDIKIYNSKIQELVDKLKMIGNERDSIVANLQEKVNLLDSDLNRKDGTVRNLRDRILELEEEKRIRDLDKKYEPKKAQATIGQSQEMNSLKRELNDRMNEIEELEAQLTQYKRISNEYQDSLRAKKHEINGLKRQLEDKTQGVQDSSQLSELLRKKNDQTHQLEEKIVQLQKFRNQNEILRQENAHLVESMRKKHLEVSDATDRVYLLEKKLREVEVLGDHSPKLIQLAQENELLQNAINKKDQEIIKLRQNSQLLQSNINELELDIEKYKNRLNAGEKNIETERSQLRARLSVLQLKTVEYQRKIAGLQEVRAIMTEQINTLTAEIHIKFQNTQRIELQLKQERARSKAFQTELEIQSAELSQIAGKAREWERKYQTMGKEFQAELDKKKDLTNTKKNEVFNLNNKCIELQNTLRNRQARIKQLQKSNEALSSKIRGFDHNLQEIQYLKHKISEYEHKISYHNHRFTSTRLPDLEPTQIFERKVIYQLKIENEQLRKQLGLAPKPEGKEANIPEKDHNGSQNVNQRLNDFNKKLEEIISENTVIDYTLSGDQLYKKFQRDRRLLIERHNQEITQLKVKIHELQGGSHVFPKKYSNINQIFNEQLDFYKEKNQQLELRVESHIKVNRELKESLELLLKSQSGEHSLTYYKEQVEKSNDTIVSLQKQLKKVNEELKKLKEDAFRINSKQVIQPSAESESKLIEQTRRINQLTLEITLLEKDRVSKQESVSKSQVEVKRLKVSIDELRASKEELQRQLKDKENTYQDELAKLANKLRFNQSEVERLNEILSKRQDTDSNELKAFRIRVAQLQEQNKKMKAKIEELIIGEEKYQREITKHENQVHILISENQRLKEISEGVGKRHREGDAELQGLRVMISDFQGKIKNLESLRDGFGYRESQLQQQIGRLQNQIKLLNAEIERLTEFTQKKVNDKDLEITRLKEAINKAIDEKTLLSDQLRDLKLLSFKSNQAGQEIFTLKEEINSLKVTLNMKHTQSENRLREIYELNDRLRFMEEQFGQSKRSFELNITEMQAFIKNLENQTANYKKMKDSGYNDSNLRIQTLEEQLRAVKQQREQEVSSFTSKITLLEIQLRDSKRSGDGELQQLRQSQASLQQKNGQLTFTYNTLNSQYELLSQEYEYLKVEFTKREEIIKKMQVHLEYLESQINLLQEKSGSSQETAYLVSSSRYTIEYLRSVFIEIETLLEQEPNKAEVLARVSEEIEAALAECTRWNESLSL